MLRNLYWMTLTRNFYNMSKKIQIEKYETVNRVNLPEIGNTSNIECVVVGELTKMESIGSYCVTITDCNSLINLHGTFKSELTRKNALYKLDTLINNLTDMKIHIEKEFKRNKLTIKK